MAEHKKRKRSSRPGGDTDAHDAKRQAMERGQPVTGWKEAKQHKAANPPFILEPAGCQIPDDVTFHVYTRERIGEDLPEDPTPLDRYEHLLYSNDHPVFEFKAHEDPMTRWTRIFVGVENSATGKKEMVQTKKLIVRAVSKEKKLAGAAAGEDGKPEARKAYEMATELGRLFGTKKAKKAIAEKERNEITMPATNVDGSPKKLDRATNATLDLIGEAGAGMATREQMQATVDAYKPVPKANLEAEDIQDVYDPVVLIGRDTLNSVPFKDWKESIESGEGIDVSSRYVASRVTDVARGPNSASRLRLLRYIYYLIVFYASASRKGRTRKAVRKKDFCELSGASSQVASQIHNKFAERGEINSFHDALILTHVLALVSVIDNFELEIQHLREDLGIDQEKFSQHFGEIGGRVVQAKERGTGKTVRVARLALPLHFPKQRRIRQKRR